MAEGREAAPMTTDKRRPGIIVLIVIMGLVSACSEPRPSVDEWAPAWNKVLSIVPEEPTAGELPRQVCQDTLASLRAETEVLFPTPDPVIDDTVKEWVAEAEHTFFECPPSDGFDNAYGTMFRLQEEIETVLAIDHG